MRGLKSPRGLAPPSPMQFETILVRSQDPTALITLNRPDKLNAMSMVLKEELIRALHELDANETTRVVVITGAGQKAFTAGADIHEFHGRTPMEQWRMYEHGTLYDAVDRMAKPILAMINGYCFGGGLDRKSTRLNSSHSQISYAVFCLQT